MFTSKETLRWTLFVRNIDVRDWKLHLREPVAEGIQYKFIFHDGTFVQVCKDGDMDIVRAMVERTLVDMEGRSTNDETPLHLAAFKGHLSVVQYLCEQGADIRRVRWKAGQHYVTQ